MRIAIMLALALTLAGVLALFPNVADQQFKLEAFGWIFETRQGPFILLLLLLLGIFWLFRRIITAILAGPGQVWQVLRSGSRKRCEARLRDGIAQLIDIRGDLGARAFRKVRGIVPGWAGKLLRSLSAPAAEHAMPSVDDDPLLVALTARMVTDPATAPRPDPATRKAHIEAWLKVHPGAPLALRRKMDMAEEEEDWATLVRLLEEVWKHGGSSAASIRPRLATAYMKLAEAQPEHGLEYLRKAHRLVPESRDVLLCLGKVLLERGDVQDCRKMWSAYLEQHDDEAVAVELYKILRGDALKAYRKLEKVDDAKMSPSRAWLRAQLAHDANLSGLAVDHMQELISSHPSRLAWQTFGDWHAENEDWAQAAHCYRKSLQCSPGIALFDKPEKVG